MNIELNNLNSPVYNVALYIRLSKEDGDKEESESITNQRKILRDYASENNYNIYDEYVDDGYTGTNFNRPDFIRLIKDIESQKVNMVITKDLSRLGRDYIETGRYIESYFPEKQVRYIAVLDDVDTFLDKNCDTVAFKNIMNDYYAKTTSRNIKKTKNKKKKEGFYYASYAPFGYSKISKSGELEIDESQAKIVRRIFDLFIEGKGTYQIANLLTDEGVLPPGLQKNMTCVKNNMTETSDKWNHNTIRRILANEIYIGNCVQNKTKKLSYKSKKVVLLSEDEYTITVNHHEPIISEKNWVIVQKMLETSKNAKVRETDALFKGILYCQHCNNKLAIITKERVNKCGKTLKRYIRCGTGNKKYSNRKCFNQYIQYDLFEDKAIAKITEVLQIYLSNSFNKDAAIDKLSASQGNKVSLEKKIEQLESELIKISGKVKMLYTDKLNGLLEEQDYQGFYESLLEERYKVEEIIAETKGELKKYEEKDNSNNFHLSVKEVIEKILEKKEYTKESIHQLVKKVEIDKDKNITIFFNFYELNYIGGRTNVKPNI